MFTFEKKSKNVPNRYEQYLKEEPDLKKVLLYIT